MSALEGATLTEECNRVWQLIRDVEIPDSRRQYLWSDVGKAAWFIR